VSGFRKTYLAVVEPGGAELPHNGELRHFLVKNERLGVSIVVEGAHVRGAKEAVLSYDLRASALATDIAPLHLIRVNLQTGRHHQIRVQLAAAGMPIWGDAKYGRKRRSGQNVALWSYSLGLRHPSDNREMTFTCGPGDIFPFCLFEIS